MHEQAVLEGAADVFCGAPCEAAYALRAGGGALRRALFRLERGRCQICRLDTANLLARLRCAVHEEIVGPPNLEDHLRKWGQRDMALPKSKSSCRLRGWGAVMNSRHTNNVLYTLGNL